MAEKLKLRVTDYWMLTDVNEFQEPTRDKNSTSRRYLRALRLVPLRTGAPEERILAAKKMMRANTAEEKRLAIQFFLDGGLHEELTPLMERGGRMLSFVLSNARRLGYEVIENQGSFRFEK